MKGIKYTTIQIPVSEDAIEYAKRYCGFYEDAEFFTSRETVTIIHHTTFDPTDSVFWPSDQIS